MKFRINLATRIYVDTARLRLCTTLVLVLLLSLSVLNVRSFIARAAEVKRLSGEMAAMDDRAKAASKGVSDSEYRALMARIDFANTVIGKKTYDWLALLDRLESAVPDGVAVSSIEPDPKKQGLKLAGVTRSFASLKGFMERLEDSKYFTDVYLTGQGDTKLGDNTQGITFTITCKVTAK